MLKPPLTELQKTLRRMHLPLLVCQDGQWTFVEPNRIDKEWVKIPKEPPSVCASTLMAEAEELMNSILTKEPDFTDVKNNLGYLYLTLGKFKEGWEKYEYRWKVDPGDKVVWPFNDTPMWDGEKDKNVFLWREQGIGDDIIFLGLVPEAYESSGKSMAVSIDPRLVGICERSMPGIEFLPAGKGSLQELSLIHI